MQHPGSEKQYRYPRGHPFEDTVLDRRAFAGRDGEIEDLLRRILSSRLLVLYGASGLGKTSLLQAGIFPELRDRNYLPLPVRLNQPGQAPVERFAEAIRHACERQDVDYTPGLDSSLWEFFKTSVFWRSGELQVPVIVLDQFEEIFTLHGDESRRAYVRELAELMSRQLPPSVRARRDAGEELPYSSQAPMVKTVVSLRESFLGQLESFTAVLPQIMAERYRLRALDRSSGELAIVEPAALPRELGYATPAFEYSDESLAEILDFLTRDNVIEPFVLQLVCSHIERHTVIGQAESGVDIRIRSDDFGGRKGLQKLLDNWYRDVMSHLPRRQRKRALKLCSYGLLTSSDRRQSAERDKLLKEYKVRPDTLDALVDERVLRREPRLGSYYYELSHDRLTTPVAKTRPWRLPKGMRYVAVFVLGTWLMWAYYGIRLTEEKQRTQEARDTADHLINNIVFNLREELAKIGQPYPLTPILEEILDYYWNIDTQNLTDDQTNAIAAGILTLGQIYQQQGIKTDEVDDLYRQAIQLFQGLVARTPGNPTYIGNLAVALYSRSHLHAEHNDFSTARALITDSHGIVATLADLDPDQHKALSADYAVLMGHVEYALGARDQARQQFESARQAYAELADGAEGGTERQRNNSSQLAWSYLNLGDLLMYDGRFSEAEHEFQAALEIVEGLGREQLIRDNPELYGAVQNRLGELHIMRMNLPGAMQALEPMLEIFQELRKKDPRSVYWLRDVALSHWYLGQAHSMGLAEANSLMSYEIAWNSQFGTRDREPDFSHMSAEGIFSRLETAYGHYNTAYVLMNEFYGLSEDAESRGDATYLLPDLAQYALDMGSLHLAVSDPDQARGFIEYGRKVTDFFIGQVLSGEDEVLPDDDEGRTNVHTQRLVAVTAVGSGRLNIHAGDWATAEQEYRNALAIAREHLELTANEAVWRNIAGVCLDGLGDSLLAQGRLAEAADAYRQALQINTELASLALESVPWQIQRAISEYKIASLAGTGGAAPNRAAKRRALDIFRPLEQGMDLPEIFRATLVTLGY